MAVSGGMHAGEIDLARFPFGDKPGMKPRPVLLPTSTAYGLESELKR